MCRERATPYLSAARISLVAVLSASCAVSYQAAGDSARIPSREIVPRGRIFPSFLPSHRRSQLLLSVAFASIPGNGEGPALRDQAGTISREAVMFLLPFCLVAWLEGPPVRLIC
jgi:hypothetical protein